MVEFINFYSNKLLKIYIFFKIKNERKIKPKKKLLV